MRYTYSLNFHYHIGFLGWCVALYQLIKGVKHWQFTHVSISYEQPQGDYIFSREWGQTLIGVKKDPSNCVVLLVESDSLVDLLTRAYEYRHHNGECYRGDCVKFAQWVLYGYEKHKVRLPGTFYHQLFPDMMCKLHELSRNSKNAHYSDRVEPPNSPTNPEWSNNPRHQSPDL